MADPKKRIATTAEFLEGSTITTVDSSGNSNVMNYIEFDVRGKGSEKRVIGRIVNIAAYFNLGVVGIDVGSVCLQGLATQNTKRFSAATVRTFMNLPLNHHFGTYEEDVNLLLKANKVGTLDEYMHMVEKSRCDARYVLPRIKYPSQNLTGLLFDSAKIVLVGASNEYIARRGGALMVYMLNKKMGIPVHFRDFRVVNMVATVNVGFRVDLKKFADSEGSLVKYSPHLFPAVIMPSTKKMTLLINYTGNCILTGANNRKDLCRFFEYNFALIQKYKVREEGEEVCDEVIDDPILQEGFPMIKNMTSDLEELFGNELCRDLIAAKSDILGYFKQLEQLSDSSGFEIDDMKLSRSFTNSTRVNMSVDRTSENEREACNQLFSIIDCITSLDNIDGCVDDFLGDGGLSLSSRAPTIFNGKFIEDARHISNGINRDADIGKRLENMRSDQTIRIN